MAKVPSRSPRKAKAADAADIQPFGAMSPMEHINPPNVMRQIAPDMGGGLLPPIDVDVSTDAPDDGPGSSYVDKSTGALVTELDDGSVEINFDYNPLRSSQGQTSGDDFKANLADHVTEDVLGAVANELLMAVDTDNQSRQTWLDTRAHGIRLLGLDLSDPQASSADSTSTAVVGQSTVRHPLLLESTIGFQANAQGELLPSGGPVKVEDKTDENGETDQEATALEDGLNYYLTVAAPEYYPDTDRLLFYVGFGGCGIKKVYNCPIRLRPVSESVQIEDFIVSNAATDMKNARCTHVIHMTQSTMKRMQLAGAYRDIPLPIPNWNEPNTVDKQKADTQGVDNSNQQPEDREFTVYEVYCELDLKGFEHKEKGVATGLRLPYRVALDKDSQKVLAIHRNWAKDDERKLPKLPFVKYSFIPGLGFYDLGLIHVVGNTTNALTAAWREMLDAGMFANFPGFLYAKLGGRQNTNEMRVPPGGGVGFDTHGKPISDVVMKLPYSTPDAGFTAFIKDIGDTGARVGGTAQVQVADGRQDAPVGTTLALIEQATKPMAAVHKRLHRAQAEEFQLLKECFREDPKSFLRAVKRKGNKQWDEASFIAALEDAAVVPQADPNTPSHLHRLMKAMGVKQLASASPTLYDMKAVDEYVMQQAGVSNPDRFFAKQQNGAAPPPDPKVIAQQLKNQGEQQKDQAQQADGLIKLKLQQNESADQAADRLSRERVAAMHLRETEIEHKNAGLDHSARTTEAHAGLVNTLMQPTQDKG